MIDALALFESHFLTLQVFGLLTWQVFRQVPRIYLPPSAPGSGGQNRLPHPTRETDPSLQRRGPDTLSMRTEVPTGAMGPYRRLRHYRPPPLRGGGGAHTHQQSNINIYIDRRSGDRRERTIMRMELVAIHTALTTLSTHD